jgi:hypothetical protein
MQTSIGDFPTLKTMMIQSHQLLVVVGVTCGYANLSTLTQRVRIMSNGWQPGSPACLRRLRCVQVRVDVCLGMDVCRPRGTNHNHCDLRGALNRTTRFPVADVIRFAASLNWPLARGITFRRQEWASVGSVKSCHFGTEVHATSGPVYP